jgi:predicted MFS family arabinose efflux permease
VYGQLGAWGYFLFGFGPVLPLLRDSLDVSRTVAALHGTMIAVGSLTAGLCYPRLTARFGRGRVGWAGLAGLCAGILLLCVGHRPAWTLAGVLVAGVFGALVVTGSSAILADHHGRAGPAAITEANAVAAGFGVAGPALVGAGLALGIGWRPVLAAVVVPAAALAVALGRVRVPNAPAPVEPGSDAAARRVGRLPRAYWPAWGVVVAIIGVEFSMTLWSSDLLRVRDGMSPGAAAAGVTAVIAGMFAGRLAGGRLALRFVPDTLLLAALALTGAGFALFWLASAPVPAVAGLALTGCGMSLHYPLAVARALEAADGRGDVAVSRIAIGAGAAAGSAPVVLGALADRAGPHAAFLIVPVVVLVASGLVLRYTSSGVRGR